jgi:2-octaprenyl-6-methoxyphenol hydroxylase
MTLPQQRSSWYSRSCEVMIIPERARAERVEVLIAGAGFAGLALAIALRQALGENFTVALADPALGPAQADRRPADSRASAVVAAARRLFERLGVWEGVAEQAQPILDMRITDSRTDDLLRPVFLSFDGDVEPGEPFAHMIENTALMSGLIERAKQAGVLLWPAAVNGFATSLPLERRGSGYGSSSAAPTRRDSHGDLPFSAGGDDSRRALADHIEIELANGSITAARLLVAADGAHSRIREQADIATHGWNYRQASIVTTVQHERDHGGCAMEHFLPGGPFAILPLKGRRCSIVWTEDKREAERIVALSDQEFHAELERRFGLELGDIEATKPRSVYPLGLWIARSFVAKRVALVGDAAHVIHPIAGQGLNMGLKDVAALAEAVVDAARLGMDIGAAAVLDRYQRWRRFDTMAMGVATDGLNRLFSNRSDALRLVRDLGLGLVDRLPLLKQLFIREAAGLVGDVPKLLRGEAL